LFDRRAGTDAIQRARAWLARPDSDILWLGTGPENRGVVAVVAGVRAFLLLSFAISTTVAGGVAYRVLYMGSSFFSFIYVIIAVVILSFLIFVGPLLVFGGNSPRRGVAA
jgi:hypothetical protein